MTVKLNSERVISEEGIQEEPLPEPESHTVPESFAEVTDAAEANESAISETQDDLGL